MKKPILRISKGMTLLEITLVLGLILALMAALLFGIGAFQDGADRARCIMNLTNLQKAMRSFMNMYEYKPGVQFKSGEIPGLKADLEANIIGNGKFIDTPLTCPADSGDRPYEWGEAGASRFPAVGVMWKVCPIEQEKGHIPKSTNNM